MQTATGPGIDLIPLPMCKNPLRVVAVQRDISIFSFSL